MGPEVAIFICMVVISQITHYTDAKPQKAFVKGYSGRNLPPGKWTQWFDASYPGMTGEYETLENVVREYGRGCDGLPCRRPLAVKAVSVFGLTPSEHRDKVHLHARTGLICRHEEQTGRRCMDYKVRFYCPFSHTDCEESTNPESRVNELDEEEKNTKLAKWHATEDAHKQPNEAINYFKTEDKIVLEIPEYVKYPIYNSPRVILPHIRGKLAQMPEYNDAMRSNLLEDDDREAFLSYLRDDSPEDNVSQSLDERAEMKDSAPSINAKGGRHLTDRVQPQGGNNIIYRHFHNHPRASSG